jgi:hypothetical protein
MIELPTSTQRPTNQHHLSKRRYPRAGADTRHCPSYYSTPNAQSLPRTPEQSAAISCKRKHTVSLCESSCTSPPHDRQRVQKDQAENRPPTPQGSISLEQGMSCSVTDMSHALGITRRPYCTPVDMAMRVVCVSKTRTATSVSSGCKISPI